ncbi:putative flap endonuclease-1-like 5' DNA nuclease [Salipiger aestuarii]|uniref:Putative flap endonuclease-1-like 5' DNA nuclease n=2 Tax=Salipiger aestuarii TaxID=568098 RepID=A0A327Y6X0_9RHOB|nr:putative flap endonuclease-1-like 5' DNA nuclease [Salipiger aestuarii]
MGKGPMNAASNRETWIAVGCVGVVVFLFALGGKGILAALLLGLLAAGLLGALLVWLAAPVPQPTALKPSPIAAPVMTPKAPVAEETAPAHAAVQDPPQDCASADSVPRAPVSEQPPNAGGDAAGAPADGNGASTGPSIKPSAALAGEAELASRKGSWRYDPAPDPRPAALEGPRGAADDLKQIKGVGPALEAQLHALGIYHFDQIASWGAPEVAWMDDNLKGFRGRVSRDDWTGQAKTLAAGQQTEFSKRVDDGGVY